MFSRSQRGHLSRGQSLVEFALVAPIVIAVMAAIIQFGIVFWAQNTLTQVVRDTGRWEATQGSCTNSAAVVIQANQIANISSLIGYTTSSLNVTVTFSPNCTSDATYPKDNTQFSWVKITITHQIPVFFPGMEFFPALGGPCTGSGGTCMTLSSTAQFRLEPRPS
jgi:Flp pilus assembly protein TadG